jgi:hypothetical protein
VKRSTFDDYNVCGECKMRKEYKYESKGRYWVCKNIHGHWDFYLGKVFGKN